jgi:tRNA-specific 2-thiouridylase
LSLGADYVATGHYCRKSSIENDGKEVFQLLAGKDDNKDQSYFLCQLSQEQLAKALFPIGKLTKPQVREIATQMDLVTADKKDSQGLCFIGKVRLPEFLQQKLEPKEGVIVEVDAGDDIFELATTEFVNIEDAFKYQARKLDFSKAKAKVVGKHQGAHYFTNGQRKGLNIYTGQGSNHPGLYKNALFVKSDEVHWIREDLRLQPDEKREVMARIRYRQPLDKATLHQFESGMYVVFDKPQSAITEGQFVAWYEGDELLGSGVIS